MSGRSWGQSVSYDVCEAAISNTNRSQWIITVARWRNALHIAHIAPSLGDGKEAGSRMLPRDIDAKSRRFSFAAQLCDPRTHGPLPSVPGRMDCPLNWQVLFKTSQSLVSQILKTIYGIRRRTEVLAK